TPYVGIFSHRIPRTGRACFTILNHEGFTIRNLRREVTPWQCRVHGAYWPMTLCRTAILVGTILAYSDAATAGQGGSPPSASPGWQILESRFSRMRGMRVENLDGQRLGSVKDFVLDIRTGEVKYALVAPGGLRNLRARSRIVPARLLSNATAKESTIEVDLTLERW